MQINKYSLFNLFKLPGRFIIPPFQRNYTWKDSEVKTLLEDIKFAYDQKDIEWYFGSIVLIKVDDNYLIIDGQQRISTTYVLFKYLYDHETMTSNPNLNLIKELETMLYYQHGYKLSPLHDDAQELDCLMHQDVQHAHTAKSYYRTYLQIDDELKHNYSLEQMHEGLSKFVVVLIELDNQDNIQDIFERINTTGKSLSLGDLVKNYLLMDHTQQQTWNIYLKYWKKPFDDDLSSKELDDFIFFFMRTMDKSFTQINGYEKFKRWFKNSYQKDHLQDEDVKLSLIKELDEYVKYYKLIIKDYKIANNGYSYKLNDLLAWLNVSGKNSSNVNKKGDESKENKNGYTVIYPLLFKLFHSYAIKQISEDTLIKIIEIIFNYLKRRDIDTVNTASKNMFFASFFDSCFKKQINDTNYLEQLTSYFKSITNTNNRFISDERFNHRFQVIYVTERIKFAIPYLMLMEYGLYPSSIEVIEANDQYGVILHKDEANLDFSHIGNLAISKKKPTDFRDFNAIKKNLVGFSKVNDYVLKQSEWNLSKIKENSEYYTKLIDEVLPFPFDYRNDKQMENEIEELNFDDYINANEYQIQSLNINGEEQANVVSWGAFAKLLFAYLYHKYLNDFSREIINHNITLFTNQQTRSNQYHVGSLYFSLPVDMSKLFPWIESVFKLFNEPIDNITFQAKLINK